MDRLLRDGVINNGNIHKYCSSRNYVWDLVRMVVGCEITPYYTKKIFLDDDRILHLKSTLKGYFYGVNSRHGLDDDLYALFSKFLSYPKLNTILRYRYILKEDGDVSEEDRSQWLLSDDSKSFIKYYITILYFSNLTLTQSISLLKNWDRVQYTCILVKEKIDDVLIKSILKTLIRYRLSKLNPSNIIDRLVVGAEYESCFEYFDANMDNIKYSGVDGVNSFYNLIKSYENHADEKSEVQNE